MPGRPPGHQHGFGTPAAAEQCSKQNVQGLPHPRAGSEYENGLHAYGADLHAYGADRYVALFTKLETIMELISRLPAASTPHERYASTKGELAPTEMKLCDMSSANFG